eukprot:Rhum_TRINITY_DN643_c0_g1::Rhum_TRINITY_DN643_c0_g1_i1::g.2047::m.2047
MYPVRTFVPTGIRSADSCPGDPAALRLRRWLMSRPCGAHTAVPRSMPFGFAADTPRCDRLRRCPSTGARLPPRRQNSPAAPASAAAAAGLAAADAAGALRTEGAEAVSAASAERRTERRLGDPFIIVADGGGGGGIDASALCCCQCSSMRAVSTGLPSPQCATSCRSVSALTRSRSRSERLKRAAARTNCAHDAACSCAALGGGCSAADTSCTRGGGLARKTDGGERADGVGALKSPTAATSEAAGHSDAAGGGGGEDVTGTATAAGGGGCAAEASKSRVARRRELRSCSSCSVSSSMRCCRRVLRSRTQLASPRALSSSSRRRPVTSRRAVTSSDDIAGCRFPLVVGGRLEATSDQRGKGGGGVWGLCAAFASGQ